VRARPPLGALALAVLACCPACSSAAPLVTFSPATVRLGVVYLGQRRTWPVVLANAGGPVTIASVELEGAGLSSTLALPRRVGGGSSTWFALTYAPPVAGLLSGRLILKDAAGRTLGSLAIAGEGVALDAGNSVSVAAYGARGDGEADDTAAFRAAARAAGRAHKVLYVPRPPGGDSYQLSGVVEIHGSVVGEPGPERPVIRMRGADGLGRPGGPDPHTIFYYRGDRSGTVIAGLHLDGGRDFPPRTRVYGMAEQSHGIALQDVSDVRIENNLIENTQGDAILIGGQPGTGPCADVEIVANVLRHPMRCAVFAADTRGLRVYLNQISKVVEYQSAMDFEPNQAPQADWDAEVAYNDFDATLDYDHGVITSTIATRIRAPGGNIRVHDNTGSPGRYSFHISLTAPQCRFSGDVIQDSISRAR